MTFLAGLASGVVLTLLSYFVRRMLQRRSRGEPMLELSTEKLRPLIPIVVGFILLFIGLFGGERVEEFAPLLVGFSVPIILISALWASH